jgi:hypothetical protein
MRPLFSSIVLHNNQSRKKVRKHQLILPTHYNSRYRQDHPGQCGFRKDLAGLCLSKVLSSPHSQPYDEPAKTIQRNGWYKNEIPRKGYAISQP